MLTPIQYGRFTAFEPSSALRKLKNTPETQYPRVKTRITKLRLSHASRILDRDKNRHVYSLIPNESEELFTESTWYDIFRAKENIKKTYCINKNRWRVWVCMRVRHDIHNIITITEL